MGDPKIIVIGAGPAGGAFSVALRQRGFGEVLLVDKSRYPRVKVCGSGLSPLALRVLGQLHLKERFAEHAVIRGLEAKGPGGSVTRLQAGEGAWVVPRSVFDHGLAQAAQAHGAEFRPETKVLDLLRDGAGQICGVRTDAEEIEADMVVCADGAASRFSTDRRPRQTIQTLMGWWMGTQLPRDVAVMVWDARLHGYYAWSFPEPGDVVNIGLTIPADAPAAGQLKELFGALLDEHFAARMQGAEQRGKWMGHPAVVSTQVGPIAEGHGLWIGEAARLVMPGTVEGIGFALQNGVAAADFLSRHWRAEGLGTAAVRRYRRATARTVLPKFWAGAAFARMMRSPRARGAFGRIMNERVRRVVENAAARMTGEGATPAS